MDLDWNDHYASGNMPWDTGEPDEQLVRCVREGGVAAGPALEIGCGTGTNSVWLAEQGFSVLGLDVSPLASEMQSYFDRMWNNDGPPGTEYTAPFGAYKDEDRGRYWRYRIMEATGLSTW
jgi:SAM-dependent methyltransferase